MSRGRYVIMLDLFVLNKNYWNDCDDKLYIYIHIYVKNIYIYIYIYKNKIYINNQK